MIKTSVILMSSLFWLTVGVAKENSEILVSAASSLKDVFVELGKEYEKNHPVKVVFNFAASGQLKTQIETGAPVDVFASASPVDMDALSKKQLIVEDTRKDFAKNSLVLIQNLSVKNTLKKISELSSNTIPRISLGNPQTVPAGRYTKEFLDNEKVFDELKGKMIFGENVRQVLDYVQLGEVDAGFVFATDAFASKKVQIVFKVPSQKHSPIVYPIAVIKASKHTQAAKDFAQFVNSETSREVLKKYGFN